MLSLQFLPTNLLTVSLNKGGKDFIKSGFRKPTLEDNSQ